MPRMRLIKEAYKEIKSKDPDSAITMNYIRKLIVGGTVPSRKAGNKYLVNMDILENYLNNPPEEKEPLADYGKIRAVST